MGELTKLRQTSTVRVYQEKFEVLANQTQDLPESFLISCFVSGLKEEIKAGVLMFKLASITNAIGLVKLQEASIEAILKSRLGPKQQTAFGDKAYGGVGGQYKRELSKEMEDKKAKGLCFKCNEKYTKGHVCNRRQLYSMEEEEEEAVQEIEEEEKGEETIHREELQIPLNAITGSISFRTMRVRGNVKRKLIIILIDSGSTHNFLSIEVAKRTSVEVEETEPLPVVVADGTRLLSITICRKFQWEMQGVTFQTDVRLLQLRECDMVLGIQWLATLGPVKWNFKNLSMEFSLNGRKHLLRGGRKEEVKMVGPEKMGKYLQKQPQGVIAKLCSLQAEDCKEREEYHQEIEALLSEFQKYFENQQDCHLPGHMITAFHSN